MCTWDAGAAVAQAGVSIIGGMAANKAAAEANKIKWRYQQQLAGVENAARWLERRNQEGAVMKGLAAGGIGGASGALIDARLAQVGQGRLADSLAYSQNLMGIWSDKVAADQQRFKSTLAMVNEGIGAVGQIGTGIQQAG